MSATLVWGIVGAIAAIGVGVLVWWLLIETEGIYLGRRVVIWLYDAYARRYDAIKGFNPDWDHHYLADPLLKRSGTLNALRVLDVATGTGRLPLALLRHPAFEGAVVGVDLSRRMLDEAMRKSAGDPRAAFVHAPAESLPFADETFDLVTCLEALEFVDDRDAVLAEIIRVLRPGGGLLISNRLTTRWMPDRGWTGEALTERLSAYGLKQIRIERWQVDYDRVFARKGLRGRAPSA